MSFKLDPTYPEVHPGKHSYNNLMWSKKFPSTLVLFTLQQWQSNPTLQKGPKFRGVKLAQISRPVISKTGISKTGLSTFKVCHILSIPPRCLLHSKAKCLKSRLASKPGRGSYLFLAPHPKRGMLSTWFFLRISPEQLPHIWI